jgi:hypothetical protein
MRIIFLDIEGVLMNLGAQPWADKADPDCVARLNRLTDSTGAALVLGSTWRSQGLDELTAMLRGWGVTGQVAGITDDLSYLDLTTPIGIQRGDEIGQWLDRHPEVEDFVILDDDDDMGGLMPFLLQMKDNTGLQEEHVEVAAKALMDGITPWSPGPAEPAE